MTKPSTTKEDAGDDNNPLAEEAEISKMMIR